MQQYRASWRAAWAVLFVAAAAAAQIQPGVGAQEWRTVLSGEARAALSMAKAEARKARGQEGEALNAALRTAAAAYSKIGVDFAGEPRAAAAATFAAAELLRRAGDCARAEQGYLAAAQLEPQAFGQRGLLAAADMQRRQDHHDDALATYRRAEAADPGTRRGHDARLGAVRALLAMDRADEALAGLRAAVAAAPSVRPMLDAANLLVRTLIGRGDLTAAQEALAKAEAAVAAEVAEQPEEAERLHEAIESLPARKALQRARDAALDRYRDAEQVEASGG